MRSLWVDDKRPKPEEYSHIAKTFDEAKIMIRNEDWDLISFDHDLGEDVIYKNGLTLMNMLETLVHFKKRKSPIIKVHTANSSARSAMLYAAKSIMKMKD